MFTPKSVTVLSLVALGFAPVAVEADVLFAESFETTDVGNLPTDWQLVTDNATTKGAGVITGGANGTSKALQANDAASGASFQPLVRGPFTSGFAPDANASENRTADMREDARLMAEAGFNVVRLADFAWAAIVDHLMPMLAERAGLSPLWQGLPEAVEVVRREGERATLWFVINRGDQPVEAPELPTGHELLSERGSTALASRLSPWEVRVIAGV